LTAALGLTASLVLGGRDETHRGPNGRPSVYNTQNRQWLKNCTKQDETPGLVRRALDGPLAEVEEIVFAVRQQAGGHFYETFGLDFNHRDNRKRVSDGGGRLVRLNVHTGQTRVVLAEPGGAMRDPYLSYDGKTILFSRRREGEQHYAIWEIGIDGSNARQLTDGEGGRFDDVEPVYLPNNEIMFVSGRARRGVPCWTTEVGLCFRCDADGSNVRMVSNGIEHEIHPWPLPDGRILYTRWEYVNRSATAFHHLWTFNPDGSAVMTYYGNQHPGFAITEARPIPGTNQVVSIFGPGHGVNERRGYVAVIDPDAGPDDKGHAELISTGYPKDQRIPYCWRDPYAIGGGMFLVCVDERIYVMDSQGRFETLFKLPDELRTGGTRADRVWVHEPRLLLPHKREPIIPDRVDYSRKTGTFILQDAHMTRRGRKGRKIDRLAVVEVLPMSTSMTWRSDTAFVFGGGYNLKRILGTVPVEEDGSAHFEVPSMRPLYFIALDDEGNTVKMMNSFTTLMPGETLSCVGCHEHRTRAPRAVTANTLAALQRGPSTIEPIAEVPDIYHYPRDIQPIWNKHCTSCHNYEKFAGKLVLTDDAGIRHHNSISFLDARNAGRNAANLAIRGHGGAKLSDREKKVLRWWENIRWQYSGTYCSFGTAGDEAGVPFNHSQDKSRCDMEAVALDFDETVIDKLCVECHSPKGKPVKRHLKYAGRVWPRQPGFDHMYNMTHPEKSLMLLAPLSKEAGGYGLCRKRKADSAFKRRKGEPDKAPPATVFASTDDPDYQALLAELTRMSTYLREKRIFGNAEDWRPVESVTQALKHYRILPPDWDRLNDPFDPFEIDRQYYRLFYDPRWDIPGKWPADRADEWLYRKGK
jgi:hypothetical protein